MKPLAERISGFYPRKEIIYRCFNCNASFAILGDRTRYCHNCGIKIDWNKILKKLDDNFGSIWIKTGMANKMSEEEFEEQFIDELNIKQLGDDFTNLYNIDGSPKKCEQCIYAKDYDACNLPKNKQKLRENIYIPRRNNYNQSMICNFYESK